MTKKYEKDFRSSSSQLRNILKEELVKSIAASSFLAANRLGILEAATELKERLTSSVWVISAAFYFLTTFQKQKKTGKKKNFSLAISR